MRNAARVWLTTIPPKSRIPHATAGPRYSPRSSQDKPALPTTHRPRKPGAHRGLCPAQRRSDNRYPGASARIITMAAGACLGKRVACLGGGVPTLTGKRIIRDPRRRRGIPSPACQLECHVSQRLGGPAPRLSERSAPPPIGVQLARSDLGLSDATDVDRGARKRSWRTAAKSLIVAPSGRRPRARVCGPRTARRILHLFPSKLWRWPSPPRRRQFARADLGFHRTLAWG